MRKLLLLSAFLLLASLSVYAQPSNDLCENDILLTELSNWCSEREAFMNADATPTNWVGDGPTCQTGGQNDVWFSFVAGATDVTIIVRGNTNTAPGGSLRRPEIALWSGSCNNFNELECTSDVSGNHIVELYKGGLIVGQQYRLQVQGRNGNEGTFQICINNYNAPTEPESDCPRAAVLCDNSPFVVQAVTGAGNITNEMDDASCFSGGAAATNLESNSTWFTWICDGTGTLEFDLLPLSEEDDLDFVIYELPNGVTDCSGKQILRCMASGDFSYPSPCMGPTGLRAGSTDTSEEAGCGGFNDDNYLAPVDMVSGRAYALVINNFTSQGNGFSIEFGGTGTFRGPDAAFNVMLESDNDDNIICSDERLIVTDFSSFPLGAIESWDWTFGVGAVPSIATGPGPHNIQYTSGGLKSVVLTIESNLGCIVTEIETFEVLEAIEVVPTLTLPDCGGGTNGAIVLEVSGGQSPYEFSWNEGEFIIDEFSLDSLSEGDFMVQVIDNQGCGTELLIELYEPGLALNSNVEPVIEPSCFGFSDGIITISPAEGTAPYEFDFGNGFTSENMLTGVSAGTYNVEVRDVVGCDESFPIIVGQPDSLQSGANATDISCLGAADGTASVSADGGVGGYTYDWSNNISGNSIDGLLAGTYTVTVQDANGCMVTDNVTINEPLGIDFELLELTDVLCYNEATGSAVVNGLGGTPPFEYSSDGVSYQTSPALNNLGAGNYTLYVRDSRGCIGSLEASIGEPEPFFVDAGEDQQINLGFSTRLDATTNPPGLEVEIAWSDAETLDCPDCVSPVAMPPNSTIYTITITDENGCTAEDQVQIQVAKLRPIFKPNVFSPDGKGDSGNETFTLFGGPAAVQMNTLKIFNRWGELVFEGNDLPLNDPTVGWDGTYKGEVLNPAVFTYFAEILFIDNETRIFEGDLTLLR